MIIIDDYQRIEYQIDSRVPRVNNTNRLLFNKLLNLDINGYTKIIFAGNLFFFLSFYILLFIIVSVILHYNNYQHYNDVFIKMT